MPCEALIYEPNAKMKAKGKMKRLRRFYGRIPDNETSRVAYATSSAALSKWQPDAEWIEDDKFNAGEAILADPSLKDVYKEAILHGYAMGKVK